MQCSVHASFSRSSLVRPARAHTSTRYIQFLLDFSAVLLMPSRLQSGALDALHLYLALTMPIEQLPESVVQCTSVFNIFTVQSHFIDTRRYGGKNRRPLHFDVKHIQNALDLFHFQNKNQRKALNIGHAPTSTARDRINSIFAIFESMKLILFGALL